MELNSSKDYLQYLEENLETFKHLNASKGF